MIYVLINNELEHTYPVIRENYVAHICIIRDLRNIEIDI